MPWGRENRRWPSSIRARLTVGYGLAVAIPLVVVAVGAYLAFASALLARTDHFIEEALHAFDAQLQAAEHEYPGVQGAIRGAFDEFRFRDLQLVMYDARHAVAGADENVEHREGVPDRSLLRQSRLAEALASQRWQERTKLTVETESARFRVRTLPVAVAHTPFTVAGVYELRNVEGTLADLRRYFLVAIPTLIALAAVIGYWLAGRTLAPVATMARRAADISARTLHERLPVDHPRDEFGRLAHVVNALLDRLERAMSEQRRFMADASHELRTPAAIIRTEADVTLSRGHREESEYRESAEVVRDAARRLTRIVGDLFTLARADSGQLTPRRDPLDLADIVLSAGRALRGIAEERGIRVALPVETDAPFCGDEDLLSRMVLNLIDNAIKFSDENGVVTVTLEFEPEWYRIGVVNGGPGIPAESHDRVFDRFYRVDKARSHSPESRTSGAGLGLAIARWAAEGNGGRLDLVESRPGHTEFRARLPRGA